MLFTRSVLSNLASRPAGLFGKMELSAHTHSTIFASLSTRSFHQKAKVPLVLARASASGSRLFFSAAHVLAVGTITGISPARRAGCRRGVVSARRARTEDPFAPCDYLVVGAGASGMAFVDTLLKHHPSPHGISVVMVDKHAQPGGHWNDSYDFVMLHQAATNYGVESLRLEEMVKEVELCASRKEILAYYARVMETFVTERNVRFFPSVAFDFETGNFVDPDTQELRTITAGTIVDARFTEPDIPVFVKPTFSYNSNCIEVITSNDLAVYGAARHRFCVIGGGKTGQDAVIYLQEQLGVAPSHIAWVLARDPWITARDPPMDTCMQFLQTCISAHTDATGLAATAANSAEFVQRGYLELEKQGKIYRIDPAVMPTRFMNATLNRHQVEVLRKVSANIIRNGRVSKVLDSGELEFADGSVIALPWDDVSSATTFVHCSAGAFNFSKSATEARPAVFTPGKITVQEVFGYPGFCFNGSLIARLESDQSLSPDNKNAMCELPPTSESTQTKSALGPSSGEIGPLHEGHGIIVSLRNLRRWYNHPGLGEWLHGSRLFSLTMNGLSLADGRALVDSNFVGLARAGILK